MCTYPKVSLFTGRVEALMAVDQEAKGVKGCRKHFGWEALGNENFHLMKFLSFPIPPIPKVKGLNNSERSVLPSASSLEIADENEVK